MQKIKNILIISSLFILILPDIFAESADMRNVLGAGCIGIMAEDVDSPYAKSSLSCW